MLGKTLRRMACLLAAGGLVLLPAAAKHRAAKHNFVDFDLTAPVPKPLPNLMWWTVALLDAASATRSGDTVSFDVLVIAQSFQESGGPDPKTRTYRRWWPTVTEHFTASCAWRTTQMPGFDKSADWGNESVPDSNIVRLITAKSRYQNVVDELCAGHALAPAQGAASIAAAVAQWKDQFASPEHFATAAMRARPAPPAEPWMDGEAPHRFVAIARDAAAGNTLFLDKANLKRDGDTVTGLTFAVIGLATPNDATAYADAAESQVRYDCAAGTMTILAQAYWNVERNFLGPIGDPWPPRAKSESAVAASEIAAACGGVLADAPAFDSIASAWTGAR